MTYRTSFLALIVALGLTAPMAVLAQDAAAPAAGHEMAHEVALGDLVVSGGFSRATLPNAPVGGGFLTITNKGATDDRLIGATSPVSGDVQLHEMAMEGDVMKMRELPDGIPVPAGETVTLQPGGLHLMFMQLTGPLVEGTSFPVTLTFEKAGAVTVELNVASSGAKAPEGMAGMSH
jgi:periplasmic copper chaperone A